MNKTYNSNSALGAGGRWFESSRPDAETINFVDGFFCTLIPKTYYLEYPTLSWNTFSSPPANAIRAGSSYKS